MAISILERILEPATAEMPPAFARKLLQLRAEKELVERIEYLRVKAEEGALSESEGLEYKEIVEAIDVISLLQQQAQKALDASGE